MNISKSRSSSPVSDVDAEYFCGQMNSSYGSSSKGKQALRKKFADESRDYEKQSFLPLLKNYVKKGDTNSLAAFITV
jgi:hypothetical protein